MSTNSTFGAAPDGYPRILSVGLSGMLVSFAGVLTEEANRAALAFRARLEREALPGLRETTTSLASTFLSFDPLSLPYEALFDRVSSLLSEGDWYHAPLPEGRHLWRIPAAFGQEAGPQLEEAAEMAGLSAGAAIEDLAKARLRVMTIGFAPGQPYLGSLPERWDIPRQSGLTRQIPTGAIAVAIRQLVLFTNDTPTGWRHVGQTAFRGFRPESTAPFALAPGDEVTFTPISAAELARIRDTDATGNGGATKEVIG